MVALPTVCTTMVDPRRRVTYHVMAYRSLTQAETISAIRHYLASVKRRREKPGSAVTILTIIGHDR